MRNPIASQTERESTNANLVRSRADRLGRLHRHHQGSYPVVFCGVELLMLPEVFCPTYGEGSQLLASSLDCRPGEKVLDMGTGSGALAILAGLKGAEVVAMDISSAATECARNNVKTLGLSNKVEVRKGDLFESLVSGERFSLVVFNPPFLCGKPQSLLDLAIWDDNHQTIGRFLEGVAEHVEEKGRILTAFSTAGRMDYFQELVHSLPFRVRVVNQLTVDFTFSVFELRRT